MNAKEAFLHVSMSWMPEGDDLEAQSFKFKIFRATSLFVYVQWIRLAQ